MTGQELRNIRESLELSQQEFADVLDYSRGYICEMENNVKPIKHKFVRWMEMVLKENGFEKTSARN